MQIQVVGCSHHNSTIDFREKLAFTAGQAREALDAWRRIFPGVEAVLGRRLVGDVLKGQLPPALRADFEASYGLTADEIIRRPTHPRIQAFLAPWVKRSLSVECEMSA